MVQPILRLCVVRDTLPIATVFTQALEHCKLNIMDRWVASSPCQKWAHRWYSLSRLRAAFPTLPIASVFNRFNRASEQ